MILNNNLLTNIKGLVKFGAFAFWWQKI